MKKDKSHKKHPSITRPSFGLLARQELSILGTNCGLIADITAKIQDRFRGLKVAYFDTDHNADEGEDPAGAGLLLNKKTHLQHSFYGGVNKFSMSTILNDLDLLLINGNHQEGANQIVVIDKEKFSSLERRKDQITNAVLLLVKDGAEIPEFMFDKISEDTPVFDLTNECPWLDHLEEWIKSRRSPLNGLVLNGGKSTRMGSPKSELTVEGETMLERTFNLLSTVTERTFYSIRTDQKESYIGKDTIEDRMNDFGPYGGIISAFMQYPDATWVVMAVDMPKVQVKHLEELLEGRDASKIATAFLNPETGFADPLLSVWEPKSFAHLLRYISLGYSCPRKVLINSDIALLKPIDAEILFNMNRPEDYQKIK